METPKTDGVAKCGGICETATFDDDDPLKETDSNDLETGPFLPGSGAVITAGGVALARRGMDKGLRRCLFILGAVFVAAWVLALVVFVSNKAYKHPSQLDHDPDATQRGSGKQVTLDQVLEGFWRPEQHYISWIAGPDGEDGLLLEQGAVGKDYLATARKFDTARSAGDEHTDVNDLVTVDTYGRWQKWINKENGHRSDVPHCYIYNRDFPGMHIVTATHVRRLTFECVLHSHDTALTYQR